MDGFLAHEVQAIVPQAVTGTKDEVDENGDAVMQGIDQSKLVPLLVTTNEHTYSHQEANREGSSTARCSNRNDHLSWC